MYCYVQPALPRRVADGFAQRRVDPKRGLVVGIVGLMYDADGLAGRAARERVLVEGHSDDLQIRHTIVHATRSDLVCCMIPDTVKQIKNDV